MSKIFKISNKFYDVLKKISIAIPLLGTFYEAFALIWGLPYGEQILATTVALETLVTGYINAASKEYAKSQNNSIDDTNGLG